MVRVRVRQRLPASVHEAVFEWVLKLCADKKLLTDPSVVGVDSTTIEANAAMRSLNQNCATNRPPAMIRISGQEPRSSASRAPTKTT